MTCSQHSTQNAQRMQKHHQSPDPTMVGEKEKRKAVFVGFCFVNSMKIEKKVFLFVITIKSVEIDKNRMQIKTLTPTSK